MDKILYYSTMFLCNISETLCILLLYATFLHPQRYSGKWHWFYLCAVSFFGYLIIVFLPLTPLANSIFVMFLTFAYTLFFEGTLFQKVLTCICCAGFLTFQSSIIFAVQNFLLPDPTSTLSQYIQMLVEEYIVLTVNWCIWKFYPRKEQKKGLSLFQKKMILLYPCIFLILIFILTKSLQQQADRFLFFIIVLLFIALLVHLVMAEMLYQQNEKSLKLLLTVQQVQTESEKADALLEAYSNQRKLTHEFDNHMMAVESYLTSGQYEKATDYIQQVSSHSLEHSLVVNTHNPAVDAILSQKYHVAVQKGLLVLFRLCDLSAPPIETADLSVILSNLFSNAIEGSTEVPNGKIQIKIEDSPSEFLISIRNPVSRNISITNNMPPQSTKTGIGHGFGLQNVIEIAHKYKANYLIECKDCHFQVTFLMNKPT